MQNWYKDHRDHRALPPMMPVMSALDRNCSAGRCWHVGYQFCDLSAEITVYAEDEADARRSLNVACAV
jgi:hypothetical protein